MLIYIPIAREYRLLPLQVSQIRKYLPPAKIILVETPPGRDWASSGGPWRVNVETLDSLELDVIPSCKVAGLPPRIRVAKIFDWLRQELIPHQSDPRALVLSADVWPTAPVDVDALFPASMRVWESFCWFAQERDANPDYHTWRKILNVKKRADTMEEWPGWFHADKLCSQGDFDANKFPILESMFNFTFPNQDEVRETIDYKPILEEVKVEVEEVIVDTPKPKKEYSEYELKRLVNAADFLARVPADLAQKIKDAQPGCGCSWLERIKPHLSEIKSYFWEHLAGAGP